MPEFVKDESRWVKAKKAAAETTEKGSDGYWALSNYLYHKMGKSDSLELAKAMDGAPKPPKVSSSATSIPNPAKQGIPSVKIPRASKQPDAFGKKSLFFKSMDKSEAEEFDWVKHPTLAKLKDFMQKKHKIKS